MSSDGTLDVVKALGTQVVEVPDLRHAVVYVHDQNIALVRAGMDEGDRAWVADWLLAAVASGDCAMTGAPLQGFELVARLGVRIVEVPDLDKPAIYVPGHDIALVRAGLGSDGRQRMARWLECQALERLTLPGVEG